LYETQQGELQSRVEDLWIGIDDLQPYAISRHVSFMRVIAQFVSRFFDSFFGSKLLWCKRSRFHSASLSLLSFCQLKLCSYTRTRAGGVN